MSLILKDSFKKGVIGLFLFLLFLSPSQAKTPQKIISLKPNITQTLIAMGLADHIVGITKFCPKPNGQAKIVGDYKDFSVEDIIRLEPDLVITSKENANSSQFTLLYQAKIKTCLLDFRTWDTTLASFQVLEEIFFKNKKKNFVQKFKTKLETIATLAIPLKNKFYVILVQRQPLMVAGGSSFISTLFSQIGLQNAFAKNQIAYPVLDEEVFIRKNSDFVFDMTHDVDTGKPFFNKRVVPIKIEDFLAAPQSLDALAKLVHQLNQKNLE